ncbi:hypothetical protein M430DRAFT_223834 [Amorphotheca resinae ATCC 22711]|uniref:Uncharacterized protein n=1 Tax=Amorphotheca resinae ATCC 22711 TaxID=857342 RepID=A0A2T3B6A6_AMORE|nr:hypothetical protein M430DRAFT_223834 [Amorphotheca resinae ATCC 22711]PSS22305.1 hypothetical protein M430DRAFT_223834 [Amorphotheca resinae ATCC 22711]
MYWRGRFCSYGLGLTHQLHGSLSSCRRVKSGLEASWNWENIERLPVPRPVLLGSPSSRWWAGWKEGFALPARYCIMYISLKLLTFITSVSIGRQRRLHYPQ